MSLSTDLQAAISTLQGNHSDLVAAVRARNGVSGLTNIALANRAAAEATLQAKADSLRASAMATPGGESLSLDFINEMYQWGNGGLSRGLSFSDAISFTRASTGSRSNREGMLEFVAANQPRFDYEPLTGAIKGLLIEEARTNLVPYSTAVQRSWVLIGAALVPYDSVAPDGTLTGVRLVEDATNGEHRMYTSSTSVTAGVAYTGSIWAKAGSRRYVYLHFSNVATWGTDNSMSAKFDTLTGAYVAVGSAVTAKVEAWPNGWFRLSITSTALSASPASGLAIGMADDGLAVLGRDTYLGDSSGYIQVWGPQFEQGAFASSYIPTLTPFASRTSTATYLDANGVIQTAATNTPRNNAYGYDQNGTLKQIGTLLEGSATNVLLYSEDLVNASWVKSMAVATAVAATNPAGGTSVSKIKLDAGAGFHFARKWITQDGRRKTLSAYVKKSTSHAFVGLRLFTGNTFTFDMDAGVFTSAIGAGITPSVAKCANGWWRISLTAAHTSDGFIGVVPVISTSISDSFTALGTEECYAWGLQLEDGESATSYIPTGATQTTRAADSSSSAQATRAAETANVDVMTPWFNGIEGTLFCQASQPIIFAQSKSAASLSSSSTNRLTLYRQTSNLIQGYANASGGFAVYTNNLPASANSPWKHAIAYSPSGMGYSSGGAAMSNPPAMPQGLNTQLFNRLNIGNNTNGGVEYFNGHIRAIKYFPKRLSNTDLQALTA